MKHFILAMAALGIILSAEGAFAQTTALPMLSAGPVATPIGVPMAGGLQTPGNTVSLPPQANVPFTTVPASPQAFIHAGGGVPMAK